MNPLNLSEFQKQMQELKPRAFDIWILPPFMMYYAWKSKGMSRTARRMLFTGGTLMFMRNFARYKTALQGISYDREAEASTDN